LSAINFRTCLRISYFGRGILRERKKNFHEFRNGNSPEMKFPFDPGHSWACYRWAGSKILVIKFAHGVTSLTTSHVDEEGVPKETHI
jgi:hypothetical protein